MAKKTLEEEQRALRVKAKQLEARAAKEGAEDAEVLFSKVADVLSQPLAVVDDDPRNLPPGTGG